MKDSIKREQNEFNGFAERENLRTKCKEIKYQQKYVRQLVDMTIDLLRLTGHRMTLILNVVAKMVQNECIKPAFC